MTTVRVAATVAGRSGALAPRPYVRTEKISIVPFRVGSTGIFPDCMTQGGLTGGPGLEYRKPLTVNRDSIRVSGGIAHSNRAHVDIETKQDPGVVRSGVLFRPAVIRECR